MCGEKSNLCCRCNCVGWFWSYWYRLCAQSRFALNNSQSQCALKFVRVCNKRYWKLHKQNHCRSFIFFTYSLNNFSWWCSLSLSLTAFSIADMYAQNVQMKGIWNFVLTFYYWFIYGWRIAWVKCRRNRCISTNWDVCKHERTFRIWKTVCLIQHW